MIAAALLAIGAVRFLPLLTGKVLIASLTPVCDQWHVNMPFAFLVSEALHEGRLPVWTDRVGGGYPLLALGEAGVLYPPHLLLYRLLSPIAAYNANVILAIATAAACAYLLCRDLGRSRAASLLGGLAYSWSGYFVLHVTTLHSVQAAAWMPLLLLCVRRGVRVATPAGWIPAGAVLALQITTGYPQVVYYSVVVAVLFGLWELGWGVGREAPQPPKTGGPATTPPHAGGYGGPSGRALNGVGGALVVVAVAMGLSAAHWLPGLELTRQSGRSGGIPFQGATESSFPLANLVTFVAPYHHGNPAAGGEMGFPETGHFWDNGYVGLLPLALALFAIAGGVRRDGRVRFLAFLLLFSLLIVLGRHTPFFQAAWHALPGMSFFRFPSRFMAVADLCLALLAAYGLDAIRARLAEAGDPPLTPPHTSGGAWGAPGRRSAFRIPHSAVPVLVAALLAVVAADLWVYAARFHRFTDASTWLAPPQTAHHLQSAVPSPARYYTFGYAGVHLQAARRARGWKGGLGPYLEQKEVLAPNSGVYYGLCCLNVFGGLDTRRGMATYRLLADDRNTAGHDTRVFRSFPRMLALLGVSHVVTPHRLLLPGLREELAVKTGNAGEPIRVYAVDGARPRVWIPDTVRIAADGREAFQALKEGSATTVEGADSAVGSDGEVLSWEGGPDWARARVRMRGPGVVVHNQRYYPGWQVAVDGRDAPLLRANYLMQGVAVPEGEHVVEFRFDSPSFRVGATISILSLVLLVAGCAVAGLRPKRG